MKTFGERLAWAMVEAGCAKKNGKPAESELSRRLGARGVKLTQQSINYLIKSGDGSNHN